MKLIPDRFQCQDHQTDLTDLVVEQLEERIPVTFRPRLRQPRPEPFRVLVTCPGGVVGTPGEGIAEAGRHEVGCSGEVRY